MTITEALAEIKTLGKRIDKKREFVRANLWRQEAMRDPLERDGGSRAALERERQAIGDLEARVVALRGAITVANQRTEIVVGGETRSIYDWLTWRREIAEGQKQFLGQLQAVLVQVRQQAMQKGLSVGAEAKNPTDILVNLNEQALADEVEALVEVLGSLDGQLSLKNATVQIEL